MQLPNRVDADEGRAPLVKWRVRPSNNETGGELGVNYAPADCKPGELPAAGQEHQALLPAGWAPPDEAESPTGSTSTWSPRPSRSTGSRGSPNVVTDYEYLDGAAWHYAETTS